MISAEATFGGTYPFAPHFNEAAGFRMHYVDEGPRDGEVVLCLHGEPTWGYLYRHLVSGLSDTFRIVVPDHMGFGKSETPASRTYWLQDHIDNIERFVLSLDLRDITLVMHDFGGPVGMGLAARHPDRIRRVISTNGPTPFGQPGELERLLASAEQAPWFQWIVRAQAEGRLETVLGELGYNILSTLKLNGFENHAVIDEHWLAAYAAPFMTPAECVGAIAWAKGFALQVHQFEVPTQGAMAAMRGRPALAIWGMADQTLLGELFLPLFQAVFPLGEVERMEGVGHYCMEDAPGRIVARVRDFLMASVT